MLQEFRVDNFKSLINVVFKPMEINLLLGGNNSGKTNLCQALRFVSGSAFTTLDACADLVPIWRSDITHFALDKDTTDFYVRADGMYEEERLTFEYELTIKPPNTGLGETTIRLDREVLNVIGDGFDRTVLLENNAGRIRLLNEKGFMNGARFYVETNASTDATMLQRLYDPEANPRAIHFKRYLTGWAYYDLSPVAMRGLAYQPHQHVIMSDGSNLASVLFGLKTTNERAYRELLAVVRKIEPEIDLVNFNASLENHVFMYFEDKGGHPLSVVNASSGTLRFLALAYVLMIQYRNNSSSLCIIEEPENGIYVGLLKTLFEMSSPGRPQLVFTSHAPYFIDLFDDRLGGIFVLDRRQGHTSITQPDTARARKWLEKDFPLGEQHFRDMLG